MLALDIFFLKLIIQMYEDNDIELNLGDSSLDITDFRGHDFLASIAFFSVLFNLFLFKKHGFLTQKLNPAITN